MHLRICSYAWLIGSRYEYLFSFMNDENNIEVGETRQIKNCGKRTEVEKCNEIYIYHSSRTFIIFLSFTSNSRRAISLQR